MFLLSALGSRGDVQPMATLAAALTDAGHEVALVALAEYRPLVARIAPAVRFVALPGSIDDALSRGRAQDLLGRSMAGQFVLLKAWTSSMAASFADVVVPLVGPGDVVVTGVLTRGASMALVAGTGCRMATLVYTGQVPTLQRESFFAPQYFTGWEPYDRWGSRFSWELATALGSALTRAVARRLGLPRAGSATLTRLADEHPVLVAASPLLVPPAPDWMPSVRQTGYLAPASDPEPPRPAPEPVEGTAIPDVLTHFLDRDPVYIGFGSFTRFTGDDDAAALLRTAELTGRPVVTLARPGATPGLLSPDVLALDEAPFEWLFGRVAATVHHGGSGTSHEALRSGRPTAVVPFGADQPYHASRLHALGLGPAPVRLHGHSLDADDLARLVDDLTTGPRATTYAARAAELGAAARAEDGVGATAALLGRMAPG